MKITLPRRISLLQVGCGGTGGYLVPKIARLLMTLAECRKEINVTYTLLDFDYVEEMNLFRQNFIANDLGENKAEVLALRYGSHFGIDIRSCSLKAEDSLFLKQLFALNQNNGINWSPNALCVLIGCVDNNNARRVMNELFCTWDGFGYGHPLIYIDSGNGKFNGQVVLGYKTEKILLPAVGDVFPDALEEDNREVPGNCALNAMENPQNIGANDMAATIMFSILNNLLTNDEINSHIISFNGRTQEISTRVIKEDS